jgi:hypothetical protein
MLRPALADYIFLGTNLETEPLLVPMLILVDPPIWDVFGPSILGGGTTTC